jgi:hypothetical protein
MSRPSLRFKGKTERCKERTGVALCNIKYVRDAVFAGWTTLMVDYSEEEE